jgi:preprotein translocase subunit SecE
MKKQNRRAKKKGPSKKNNRSAPNGDQRDNISSKVKEVKGSHVQNAPKKALDKSRSKNISNKTSFIGRIRQFFRESKKELSKVKWPTRKELFASVGVVVFLTLLVSMFLGLVDFGLIKILKNVVR